MAAKNIIKKAMRVIVYALISILVYGMLSFIIPYIPYPSGSGENREEPRYTVYLLSNGVHTDIVLPLDSSQNYFVQSIKPPSNQAYRYMAIGWGDKGFYLNTPTWADLTFSTAFKALFGLGGSAMHCTWYTEMIEGEKCKAIRLNEIQYQLLCNRIETQFKRNQKEPIPIEGYTYGNHDRFFEAKGRYSFFYSCNTWTNSVLKEGQVSTAIWTLYPKPLFHHLSKE
jgi:uncharacterized protein (TIGR02117 family)